MWRKSSPPASRAWRPQTGCGAAASRPANASGDARHAAAAAACHHRRAARPPRGPGLVPGVVGRGLPVIAIGGATPERRPELRAAGVYREAAIRAVWDAADPRATARRMVQELNQ